MHTPVLIEEVIQLLAITPDDRVLDATLGWGGHAMRLIQEGPAQFAGIDQDPVALAHCRQVLPAECLIVEGNFRSFATLIPFQPTKILADLGMSSMQLDDENRGFSFMQNAPLDMRMSQSGRSASDWLQTATPTDLSNAFYRYGDLIHNRQLVNAIIQQRKKGGVTHTNHLVELVKTAYRFGSRGMMMKTLSQVFQAVRMAINDELDALQQWMQAVHHQLPIGGRVAIITFHSIEDRLVKHGFHAHPDFKALTKHVIQASQAEITANPRSKPAKLRVYERQPNQDTASKSQEKDQGVQRPYKG